jgi:fatty acid-binding protein DegV
MVRESRPRAAIDLVGELGPTVGTHAGPGAFVVAFVHDPLDTGL